MSETIEQQERDADMIFRAISSGGFDSYREAERAVVLMYVPDMSVSRAGISYALKRLEKHYAEQGNGPSQD